MIPAEKLRFRKGDLLAVALVAVLAVAIVLCFLPQQSAPAEQAQIYLNGQLVQTVDLHKNQTLTISDRYCNVITVTDGTIAITDSDCPGRDCVHSGSIRTSGRSLVCLPNGLEIRIVAEASDVDFVVR